MWNFASFSSSLFPRSLTLINSSFWDKPLALLLHHPTFPQTGKCSKIPSVWRTKRRRSLGISNLTGMQDVLSAPWVLGMLRSIGCGVPAAPLWSLHFLSASGISRTWTHWGRASALLAASMLETLFDTGCRNWWELRANSSSLLDAEIVQTADTHPSFGWCL